MVLLFCLVPAVARAADDGWWGYIERLSGPGPFHLKDLGHRVTNFDIRVVCFDDAGRPFIWRKQTVDRNGEPAPHTSSCLGNPDDIKAYATVHYGIFTTGPQHQFDEPDERSIDVHVFESAVRFRVRRGLDLGFAMGWMTFNGDSSTGSFSETKGTVTPISLVSYPILLLTKADHNRHSTDPAIQETSRRHEILERIGQAVGVHFDQAYRFGTISSEQLGGAPGKFKVDGEWNTRWSIVVDVGALFLHNK